MKKLDKNKNLIKSYQFTFVLIIVNVFIVSLLLVLMNFSSHQNDNVTATLERISDLNIKNQVLQQKIASVQNIDVVNKKINELGMVEANNIQYLHTPNLISYNTTVK